MHHQKEDASLPKSFYTKRLHLILIGIVLIVMGILVLSPEFFVGLAVHDFLATAWLATGIGIYLIILGIVLVGGDKRSPITLKCPPSSVLLSCTFDDSNKAPFHNSRTSVNAE